MHEHQKCTLCDGAPVAENDCVVNGREELEPHGLRCTAPQHLRHVHACAKPTSKIMSRACKKNVDEIARRL